MGYFVKDKKIAKETISPAKVSLSSNPNFIQFECDSSKQKFVELEVNINYQSDQNGYYPLDYAVVIIQTGSSSISLIGLPESLEAQDGDETFRIIFEDKYQTALNLFECMKKDSFLTENYQFSMEENVIKIIPSDKISDIPFSIKTLVGYDGSANYDTNFIEVNEHYNNKVEDVPISLKLNIIGKGFKENNNVTEFSIKENKTGEEYILKGTTNIKEIDNTTFYLGPRDHLGNPTWSLTEITSSFANCLSLNKFLKSNFEISTPFINSGGEIQLKNEIHITSKGYGEDFTFSITPKDEALNEVFFNIAEGDPTISTSGDAISLGYKDTEIQLDIYKDTEIFLGENDLNNLNSGSHIASLSKAYFGSPIWFDINTLQMKGYSTPSFYISDWWNTGTAQDIRFTAKRLISNDKYYTNDIFYYSSVFYAITGYNRNLEINDLSEYVYDMSKDKKIRPLTHQPTLNYIAKQSQYFNFILSDSNHKINSSVLSLQYEMLSQSGKPIAKETDHNQIASSFHVVNTIKLDIDKWLTKYSNTGIVKVRLCRNDKIISEPLTFNILPSHLYNVNDYAFLNSLGGWSSFNFGDSKQVEFKTSANTYYSNHTPSTSIYDSIETVKNKTPDEKYTVQTMPISRQIADWLKEMSSSIAVYELSTGRYIVVDDLNIKHTSKDNLLRVEMKYHYSDSYNAELK